MLATDRLGQRQGGEVSEYRCPECGYIFREESGDAHEGYPPGTPFASLPEDFVCPDCSVRRKEDFEAL
jgi:rubredoxin